MKLNLTFRPEPPEMSLDRAEVVWGIRRQAGCGDLFDPSAQAGTTSHAFAAGRDDVAVCGFRPLRFRRRRAMPVAAATEYNPRCPKCLARLPEVTRSALVVVPTLTERVAIPEASRLTIQRKRAPEPVQIVKRSDPRRRAKDLTRAA